MDAKLLLAYEKRKALAIRAKPRRSKAPVWLHPIPLEREYAGALLSYVEFMRGQANQILIPALPGLTAEADVHAPKTDGYVENLDALMKQLSVSIDKNDPRNWDLVTMDIGQKVSKWNSAQWQKTLKQVTGVNTLQYEPWLQDMLKSFSGENVSLIKSIKDKSLTDIETMTQRALRSGTRHEAIAKAIEDIYDTTRSRAKLIARDQVSKLNGQLMMTRQKDIGINEYIWHTAHDDRVRSNHKVMDGKKCRWDNSMVFWNGTDWVPRSSIGGVELHPGMDFQCRCWAEPVFDAIYQSIDQGTYQTPVTKDIPKDNTGSDIPYTPSGLTKTEIEEKLAKKYGFSDRFGGSLKKDAPKAYYDLFNDDYGKNTGFRPLSVDGTKEIEKVLKDTVLETLPIEKVTLGDLTGIQPTAIKSKVMELVDLKWLNEPNYKKPLFVYYTDEYGKAKKVLWDGNHRVVAARAQNLRSIEARVIHIKSAKLMAAEAAEKLSKSGIPGLQPNFKYTSKVATPEIKTGIDFIKICKNRNIGETFAKGIEDVDKNTLGVIAERMTWYRANFNTAVSGYEMIENPGSVCAHMTHKNILGIGSIKDYNWINNVAQRESGHWPKGVNSLKGIIDHEMGHAIFNKNLTTPAIEELRKYRNTLSDVEVKRGLSEYALAGKYDKVTEFMAEGWAEYTNNPNPRPIAKKIGDIMIKGWKV